MLRLTYIAIFLFFSSASAQEKIEKISGQRLSWVAHILRQKSSTKIADLKIVEQRLPVVLIPHNKDLRPLVEVQLIYPRTDWVLSTPDGKPAKKGNRANEFVVHAFLNSQISELSLTAKGPANEIETEMIYIFAPEAQEFQIVSPWNALSASVGLAFLTYEQTLFGVLALQGGMLGLDYLSKESSSRWGQNAHIDMTVLTIKSDPVPANPQLIDARFLLSYRLPWKEQTRFRYKALFGFGYLSLISNGSAFGFSGLMYPDFALRAQQYLGTQSSFIYELRLVPLSNMSFSDQRGIHGALTWSKTLKSLRRQDVSIKFSNTRFSIDNQSIGVELFSLSLGYSI